MKRFLLLFFALLVLLTAAPLPSFAAEDTVFVETGATWAYFVTDDQGFDTIDSDWNTLDFAEAWAVGSAPFGDRIQPGQAQQYGWTGDMDAIFLRTTFKLRSATVLSGLHFYLRAYYDNSVHVYLNGTEIFAHDNGGSSDWTDGYVLVELDSIPDLLRKGSNLLAVSVHDNAGGREFDLSFFATVNPIDESSIPSEPNEPNVTDKPIESMSPEDFGSSIPFVQATEQTVPPLVTVYVTADPAAAATVTAPPSYAVSIALVGCAAGIAILLVVVAYLISRRSERSGEGK